MIAAGSLFTSCVENTEPQGIRDLREAKADYLASLSKLREADAEKVKAEAAVEQAKAEVQKAIAAQNQALAEAQKIANEAASIANEEAAARAKAAIDTIRAKAELDAVKAQEALAKAQADLDKALRKIAAEAIGLTGDEKQAIWEKTFALNIAYASYNAWLDAYNGAVQKLWEAEYAVAAGKEGYETADSYRDSIADQNALIAKANETIASLEALKEHPQAVKDTLDAIDAQIAELTKQIALIVDEKILYEATPGFVAAKAEFAKRVETFKDDSLKGAEFKFVDEDEDGTEIPVAYELTDGLGVDGKFGLLINNYSGWTDIERGSDKGDDYLISYEKLSSTTLLPNLGFAYFSTNSIGVGVKYDKVTYEDDDGDTYDSWENPSVVDDPETLEEGLDVLDKIVETLNRELVVIDNLKDSTTIEDAKKAAQVADSVFDAHYAILKDGLKEYAPYKDSVKKVDTLKEAYKVAFSADSTAQAKVAADVENIKSALKATANEYITAVEEFTKQVNNAKKAKAESKKIDSTSFISAIIALGKAEKAYFGKEVDSLSLFKSSELGDPKEYKLALSELKAEGFKIIKTDAELGEASLYGGDGYGVYANAAKTNPNYQKAFYGPNSNKDAFTRIVRLVVGESYAWAADIEGKNVAKPSQEGETYTKDSPVAYTPVTDTVKWGSIVAKGVKAPYETLAADQKFQKDTTAVALAEAEDALESYEGVTKASVAYQKIYKSFWGITGNLDPEIKKACVEPQKFTWTKKTFLEPTNCVKFNYFDTEWWKAGASIILDSTLKTVLDNVDPQGYFETFDENYWENRVSHRIFKNEASGELTEFAQAILKAQIVEDLGEYVPNKARLEKIKAQVAQIRTDVEAAIAEYEAATEGLEEVLARLCGVDEDGTPLFSIAELDYLYLEESRVEEGKWAFGGYLLEWAEELAPEYPEIVKDVQGKTPVLFGEIAILTNYRNTLDWIFTGYYDFFEDPEHAGWNVEGIIDALNVAIKDQKETVIAGCEAEIARFEEIIDACEAGYSPAEAKVAPLKKAVEAYKKYLEQAEEALARAQKEYDEVIAQYGVKE